MAHEIEIEILKLNFFGLPTSSVLLRLVGWGKIWSSESEIIKSYSTIMKK